MSRLGGLATAAAVVLGAVTVATWTQGDDDPAVATPPLSGASLFVAKGCSTCHLGPDTRPFITAFPPLDDARSWAGGREPGVSAAEYLAESMATPAAFISPVFTGGAGPTTGMPQLQLSPREIDALVAYLLTG